MKEYLDPFTGEPEKEGKSKDLPSSFLICSLFQLKGAFQRNNAVKYQMLLCCILCIHNIIAVSHKLESIALLCILNGRLDEAFLYLQRIGVHNHFAVRVFGVIQHHIVIQSCRCLYVILCACLLYTSPSPRD